MSDRKYPRIALAITLAVAVAAAAPVAAQPGQRENPLSFDRNIRGLLNKFCYRCHNADEPNGGVDLQSDINPRLIADKPLVWRTALDQVRDGEMPPGDAKQPTDEQRELIARFIETTVSEFDCDAARDPGPPSLRRLNRAEYDLSIRHLTGLDMQLSEDFPADTISFGFRNIAQSLTLSPLHVDRYYSAARRVVDELLTGQSEAEQQGDATARAKAYRQVFFVEPGDGRGDRDVAEQLLRRFATRAFRRDVDDEYLARSLSLYDSLRDRGESHLSAVGHLLTAVLASPRFLMRSEMPRPESESDADDTAYPVDDFDLASRLSFFLWSSPPDDELLELAREGRLSDDAVLDEQLRRMLDDPRSDALVEHFFVPWLQIDALDEHRPDRERFPEFNDRLYESIRQEPRRLLRYLIREDRPLTELVDADYALVDAVLSRWYELPGDQSVPEADDSFRRVVLSDRRRGGILTTAAVLMAQSDPGRTNVPRRGNFIAAAILGTAPPPPPPDVPELSDDEQQVATLTLRQRFEAHRSDPQCFSCHVKIDPLGFALENYDAIGRWRLTEVGQTIDASGQLPDGRRFDGPVELKATLLADRDELTAVLTRQMLIYALGRGPLLGDDCVIEDAVEAARQADYRLTAVIRTIIHSFPFRHTRDPEF